LDDQALTGIVVRFAFASTAELDLKALEVGLVLDFFDEWLHEEGELEWMEAIPFVAQRGLKSGREKQSTPRQQIGADIIKQENQFN
jgi:hypothetical protein